MRRLGVMGVLLAACGNDYEVGAQTDPADPPLVEGCPQPPVGFAAEPSACEAPPTGGWAEPVLEWQMREFPSYPDSVESASSPVVAQLTDDDGDGVIGPEDTPDIVLITFGDELLFEWMRGVGVVRALSGDGAGEHWAVRDVGALGASHPAVIDLDGDGVVEVLVPTIHGVSAFEHDGTLRWESDAAPVDLQAYLPISSVAAADLEGDGVPEVVLGHHLFDAHGALIATGEAGSGQVGGSPGDNAVLADLDGDGVREVIVGDAAYRPDGSLAWSTDTTDGFPAVGDLDGDGLPELVAGGDGAVWAVDGDGALLWSATVGDTWSLTCPPTPVDVDGDGLHEVAVASDNVLFLLDGASGATRWSQPVEDDTGGCTVPTSFDFDLDGASELVVADGQRLAVIEGDSGLVRWESWDHYSWTGTEYALVADVDGDAHAEIVVVHNYYPYPEPYQGISVYGSDAWPSARTMWSQHASLADGVDDLGAPLPAPSGGGDTPAPVRHAVSVSSPAPSFALADAGLCVACEEGRIEVQVHPGNTGEGDSAPGVLVLYAVVDGDEVIVDRVEVGPVGARTWDDAVALAVEDLPLETVEALVVRASMESSDCTPDDDVLRWEGPFCAGGEAR